MRLLVYDVREASRALRKQPRFLIIAASTLALGIAAVTSIFSVVNGVLLKPLPYPHAERLVNVWSTAPAVGYDRFPLSPDLFFFYRRHNTVFEDMALFQSRRANITEAGAPEVVDVAAATHSYFATLGATASLGRTYTADEDRPEAPRVVVMSHRLWTRRYGSDRALIRGTVQVDGESVQVIGIAPAWLDRRGSPDLWLPARFNPDSPPATGDFGWNAIARLKPHVGVEQASTHLEPLVRRALEEIIQGDNYRAFLSDGQYRPLVRSMKEDVIGSAREPLWILLGTVGMVLLVACGNVANLCLIRAEARQREIAVRLALGGRRRDLIRKLLAEAFLLSAIGSGVGVAAAALALPALLRLAPSTIPRLDQVGIDGTVLGFAVGAAVVSALLVGLVPALRYTRVNVLAALRHGGRSATDSRHRGRSLLVIAQTAMALVLLVGSGLLVRSFSRLMATEPGFVSHDVLTFRLGLPETRYPKAQDVAHFGQQLVRRLSELPTVASAGAVTELPMAGNASGTAYEFSGRPLEPGRLPPVVFNQTVTPGYFATLRMPIVRGRDFDSSDLRDGVRSVIVNQAVSDQYWPDEDPIGKQLRVASSDEEPESWFTVVGITTSVRQNGLREAPPPLIYFPLNASADRAPRALSYAIRGPHLAAQADAVRQAVWALDPDLPLAAVQTMSHIVEQSVVQFSFTMLTLGIAAVIALILGAVGLYGVLSYAVSLRTREIGVRLALGASTSRVMRSVVAYGATITGIGLLVGMLGAVGLTRFLGVLLYETEPLDLATFAGMSAALFGIALLASYVPARRAAAVSPLEAMRTD